MSAPTVVLVAPPAVACANPAFMRYGGVERAAWRLTRLLVLLGAEVVPVASADSTFGADVSSRGLSVEQAWTRPNRIPQVYTEDVPAMLARFGAHVEAFVARERPDTVILLGPSLAVLNGALHAAKAADAQVLVALHNGPGDNVDTVPLLSSESDITLFALSEVQRLAFGALADRIEVVTDGIPVAAVPFVSDPATIRSELAMRPVDHSLNLRAERPLIGQIDYFHSNKAMLSTLRMFRDSGIWRTHDLVLAGGPGWQLPNRVPANRPSYLTQIRDFIAKYRLEDHVHVLGPLSGRQVAELFGAMDLAISPVRLEDPPAQRDPESYGQGRAVANAAGTPVLMSGAYDPSFAANQGLIFGDLEAGVERLHDFAAFATMRRQVRRFAEQRDTMIPGLSRYASFLGLQPSQESLEAAVRALVATETDLFRHLRICIYKAYPLSDNRGMSPQVFTLIGVVVGLVGSFIATTLLERARSRQNMVIRWDTASLEAFSDYLKAVTGMARMAGQAARQRGWDANAAPRDLDEALRLMEEREDHRTIAFERLRLVADGATILAATRLNEAIWPLEWLADGRKAGSTSAWQAQTQAYARALDDFHAATRNRLSMLVPDVEQRTIAEVPLPTPPTAEPDAVA